MLWSEFKEIVDKKLLEKMAIDVEVTNINFEEKNPFKDGDPNKKIDVFIFPKLKGIACRKMEIMSKD